MTYRTKMVLLILLIAAILIYLGIKCLLISGSCATAAERQYFIEFGILLNLQGMMFLLLIIMLRPPRPLIFKKRPFFIPPSRFSQDFSAYQRHNLL
jgi:hypothetical protein